MKFTIKLFSKNLSRFTSTSTCVSCTSVFQKYIRTRYSQKSHFCWSIVKNHKSCGVKMEFCSTSFSQKLKNHKQKKTGNFKTIHSRSKLTYLHIKKSDCVISVILKQYNVESIQGTVGNCQHETLLPAAMSSFSYSSRMIQIYISCSDLCTFKSQHYVLAPD